MAAQTPAWQIDCGLCSAFSTGFQSGFQSCLPRDPWLGYSETRSLFGRRQRCSGLHAHGHFVGDFQSELLGGRPSVYRNFQKTARTNHCHRAVDRHGTVEFRQGTAHLPFAQHLTQAHPFAGDRFLWGVRDRVAKAVNVNDLALNLSALFRCLRPWHADEIFQLTAEP